MGNDEMRCRALCAESRLLTEITALRRLHWLGKLPLMITHCITIRTIFACAGQGSRKRRGGGTMSWCNDIYIYCYIGLKTSIILKQNLKYTSQNMKREEIKS